MNATKELQKRSTVGAAVATAAAAVIIGCGGGGGGDTFPTTTGGPTTGTSATGSTTSTNTNGTTSTTSGNTTGNGVLPPNVIFFTQAGQSDQQGNPISTAEIRYVKDDGSGLTEYAILPPGYSALAPSPTVAGQKFFGARKTTGGAYGIFKANTISVNNAVQVVAPLYKFLDSIAVTNDGRYVLYIASTGDEDPSLFIADATRANATPVRLDNAFNMGLSFDGTKVVYSKLFSGNLDIYVRDIPAGTATRLITGAGDDDYPQFSKDGSKIVFTSDRGGNFDLFTANANAENSNVAQVTNTTEDAEFGASFSSDNTTLSYALVSGRPENEGLYRIPVGGGNRVRIVDLPAVSGTYWTGFSGKSRGGNGFALMRKRLKKD